MQSSATDNKPASVSTGADPIIQARTGEIGETSRRESHHRIAQPGTAGAAEEAALSAQVLDASRLAALLAAEAELATVAPRIAALEARIERDAEIMSRRQAALEMSAMAVRKTLSFQLGNVLINGFKSPRSFVKLPAALLSLRSEARTRRTARRGQGADEVGTPAQAGAARKGELTSEEFEAAVSQFHAGGVAAVSAFLAARNTSPSAAAGAFTLLARQMQSILPEKAAEAAREAHARDPQPYRAKWLAFRLFDAGFLVEPAELLAALPGTTAELSTSEQRRAEEIAALARLHQSFPVVHQSAQPAYVPTPGTMLYVAASALPYHTSGYTVRTHELVRAMSASGIDVTVLTRPGYPWDRSDRKGDPLGEQTVIDQVLYLHQASPSQALPLDVYFDEAARAIAAVAMEQRVAVIHAASNHVNALPALLAARRLGIPFVYEMRGLWELSRASKVPNYASSQRYQLGLDLEAFVAKNADRVYVISNALGKLIEQWGVDPQRMTLLPNCMNADTIAKAEATQATKIADVFTVGYAGAMVGYEGLDVLIDAIAHLKARGQRVNARLIGDGDMRSALEALAGERGLSEQVQFLGKLPPDRARAELASTNAVAIPRKPHHVCEIIPPIKLVEAMALGMPVIVPNLPVFCEEVKSEETGILFKAGDAVDLAAALERLMNDPQLVADLGARAREHARTARVWGGFADQIKANLGIGGEGTQAHAGAAKAAVQRDELEILLEHFDGGGVAAVSAYLAAKRTRPQAAAAAFTALARHLHAVCPIKAAQTARAAYLCDPQPNRAKLLAFRLFDAGVIEESTRLLANAAAALTASERRRAEQIAAHARLKAAFPLLPAVAEPAYEPLPSSLLYVAASSMPYHTSGYTVRTHELVRAIAASGVDVTVLTRPGYPWDRADRKCDPEGEQTIIDKIVYLHQRAPTQTAPLDIYFDEAARAIAAVAKERRVFAIHAASNHVNALPALLAARSLGIPFIYEMRGLWELSRSSKVEGYETSERFQLGLDLEAYVAKNADRVYVISNALGDLIQTWGVDPARLSLLPNCINPETILRAEDQQAEKIADVFTVGYAGAMVGYEGLDVLIEAIAQLKARGQRVNARLIGDGEIRAALEALTAERGLTDQIQFLGHMAPDSARAELSATNAVAIPRKPYRVCEIVPPIKLVEAMALGMPVIVPNLPVFCEEVRSEVTGILFKAGDPADLANALERLIRNPQLVIDMGERARVHAGKARVWREFATQIKGNLDTARYVQLCHAGGAAAVIEAIHAAFGDRDKRAAAELMRAVRLLAAAGYAEAEYPLVTAALALDRSESVLRAAFWVSQRALDFGVSSDIILELERMFGESPDEKQLELLTKMRRAPAYLLSVLKTANAQAVASIDSIPGKLCYVLHNTLPYSSGGYATRSHGVASGIRQAGWDVVLLSRPGFPLDIKHELTEADVAPVDIVDGIPYVRTLSPLRAGLSAREYLLASADAIEARLREYRPSIVIAASNHTTALPALIAARRLGLPFIYEVRGLWEITRLSRDIAFGDTPAFHVQKMLESSVAEMANHVFTLTEPMREELVARGVPANRIDLLPNSCDPTRFKPVRRNKTLARSLAIPAGVPVIGYIGTFVDYEGLENLAEACALLKQRGIVFRLLMVGNENASGQTRGPITEEIIRIAASHGFSDWLILTGRVPHEEVEAYYSLVDIAPFPRIPVPVCEMVSPMKPLEALAMEKAVVVSSVRALTEMVQDGQTGLVFEKGSIESLASTLKRLIDSPKLRARLGANGRKWVERERTWVQVGEKAGVVLTRITDVRAAGAA